MNYPIKVSIARDDAAEFAALPEAVKWRVLDLKEILEAASEAPRPRVALMEAATLNAHRGRGWSMKQLERLYYALRDTRATGACSCTGRRPRAAPSRSGSRRRWRRRGRRTATRRCARTSPPGSGWWQTIASASRSATWTGGRSGRSRNSATSRCRGSARRTCRCPRGGATTT